MLGEGWWARWSEEALLPPVLYFVSPKQDGLVTLSHVKNLQEKYLLEAITGLEIFSKLLNLRIAMRDKDCYMSGIGPDG